jgi:hypothetical protein
MTAAPLSPVETHAEQLRRERAVRLARLAQRYADAERVLEQARKTEQHARAAKEEAYRALRDEMRGDTTKVVGDHLITVNEHGGVNIQRVDVLPLPGTQPCLL